MADEYEGSRLAAALSNLETRLAALEKKLDEHDAKLIERVDDQGEGKNENPLSAQAKRLAQLEERHENLLRYTPEAREEPGMSLVTYVILSIIALIIMVSVSKYISP